MAGEIALFTGPNHHARRMVVWEIFGSTSARVAPLDLGDPRMELTASGVVQPMSQARSSPCSGAVFLR
jgi:hypothetical protein